MPAVVKAKFSKNYWAVQKRVQRLPQLGIGMMRAKAKKDAKGVIKLFQDGIKNRSLRLKPLKPETVAEKERKGWSKPNNPLYGIGLDDPNTYINALEVVEKGNRLFIVQPKKKMHRADPDNPGKKRIRLDQLFDVHEYGTVIANGFGRGIFIRIPARPALRYAYRAYLRKRLREDPTPAVRIAIAKYIRNGDEEALKRIKRKMEIGFEEKR